MRKEVMFILPLVAAMVSIAGVHGVWWLESAVAQSASMAGNMTAGTNMTNATMNGNMTATSGGSAKTLLEDGIKALQSGDKEGAMTQLTAAQQAMSGSSQDAIMHFEEGMKALESGDTDGAIMHLKVADQLLG
jgi:outer membrane protein assembly factor BamD (BamD/ComL family)